jgi:DNA-binding transcriptional regulator YiaG
VSPIIGGRSVPPTPIEQAAALIEQLRPAVKAARHSRKVPQTTLAAGLGVSASTVSGFERGVSTPAAAVVLGLAVWTGWDVIPR